MKKDRIFEIAFNMANVDKREYWNDIDTRAFFILLLTCYAFEKQDIVSLYDLRLLNKRYTGTVVTAGAKTLEKEGYIKIIRSKAYFSKAYIELTEKGLLFKSKMFALLNKKL